MSHISFHALQLLVLEDMMLCKLLFPPPSSNPLIQYHQHPVRHRSENMEIFYLDRLHEMLIELTDEHSLNWGRVLRVHVPY